MGATLMIRELVEELENTKQELEESKFVVNQLKKHVDETTRLYDKSCEQRNSVVAGMADRDRRIKNLHENYIEKEKEADRVRRDLEKHQVFVQCVADMFDVASRFEYNRRAFSQDVDPTTGVNLRMKVEDQGTKVRELLKALNGGEKR